MALTIDEVRGVIEAHLGERVCYHASNGRRKAKDSVAVIDKAYPSLFTLHIESLDSTISFRYTDIITQDLILVLEESGIRLL